MRDLMPEQWDKLRSFIKEHQTSFECPSCGTNDKHAVRPIQPVFGGPADVVFTCQHCGKVQFVDLATAGLLGALGKEEA